jgi:phospholipase A1/A2
MPRWGLAMVALAFSLSSLAQQKTPPAARDVEECRKLEGKPGEVECWRGLPRRPRPGYIADEWALDRRNVPATQIVPYRPTYVIVRATNNANEQPTGLAEPQDLDDAELKFQLSLRGEVVSPGQLEDLGAGRMRLWLAYTQQSNWQAFNTEQSRPFRDTNYEPEVILTYDSREDRGQEVPVSLRPALVNLGLVHQSNGRGEPLSRSWWRVYLQGGWQLGWGSLLARGWRTFHDDGWKEDNPDINDYVGRGDLSFRSKEGGFNVLVRSNLRREHRGFLQVDWRLPWLPLFHLQLTHGYGESLLDYNHKQTTFGVGVAFWDW